MTFRFVVPILSRNIEEMQSLLANKRIVYNGCEQLVSMTTE